MAAKLKTYRVVIDPRCTTYGLDKDLFQQAIRNGIDDWRLKTGANVAFTFRQSGGYDVWFGTREIYRPDLGVGMHARGEQRGKRLYLHNGYIGRGHGKPPTPKWYAVFTNYPSVEACAMHEAGHLFFTSKHCATPWCVMNISGGNGNPCPSVIGSAIRKWGQSPLATEAMAEVAKSDEVVETTPHTFSVWEE